jgi:acetate kinase
VNVLVFNPGSATLKFGLYRMPDHGEAPTASNSAVVATGLVERMGTPHSELRILRATQAPLVEALEASTSAGVVEQLVPRLIALLGESTEARQSIDVVGCRVVHGGASFIEPTSVTPAVLDELRKLEDWAPLHMPADISTLERIRQWLPGTPLVAVFDTAFHQSVPEVAHTYALPHELSARYGLRRYGFHGISHAYVSRRLIERLQREAKGTRLITCDLGSGASVCAILDGRSIDISMGMTPMEGLVMGTRSGDVDPGIVLYLIRSGLSVDEVDDLLNLRSGLRGLSGLSSDVRDLERAALGKDERAELALEIFAYRTSKYIGAFAAALGGLDAIAFTGGIGEKSPSMRSRICRRLGFLGLHLEDELNRADYGNEPREIGAANERVQIWVIPADEEFEIARSAHKQLASRDRPALPGAQSPG